jgi:hypothetical protein
MGTSTPSDSFPKLGSSNTNTIRWTKDVTLAISVKKLHKALKARPDERKEGEAWDDIDNEARAYALLSMRVRG